MNANTHTQLFALAAQLSGFLGRVTLGCNDLTGGRNKVQPKILL